MEINKFPGIFQGAYGDNAGDLDCEEGKNGEHQRHVKVRIHASEERREDAAGAEETDRSDARRKFNEIRGKYKKKNGDEIGKETASHVAAFERLGDIIVHESEELFEQDLKTARHHFHIAAYHDGHDREQDDDHPARDERIGDRKSEKSPETFGSQYHVDAALHGGILAHEQLKNTPR